MNIQLLLFWTTLWCCSNVFVRAEYAPLENTPQDVEFISIDPHCSLENHEKPFTIPVWTIEPVSKTSPVQILTNPPGLITAAASADGTLLMEFTNVAFGVVPETDLTEGTPAPPATPPAQAGVRILMPYDKLETLSVLGPYQVQVLGDSADSSTGFTNINHITVNNFQGSTSGTTTTTLYATLNDLPAGSKINLSLDGMTTAVVLQTTADTPIRVRARGDDSTHTLQILQAGQVTGSFHGHGSLMLQGNAAIGSPDANLTHYGDGLVSSSNTEGTGCQYYDNSEGGGSCIVGSTTTTASVVVPALPLLSSESGTSTCITSLNRGSSAPAPPRGLLVLSGGLVVLPLLATMISMGLVLCILV